MALYVEEFLWRGRPEGSKQPVAYHVIIGEVSEDAFGRQRITLSDPMTAAQAEAMGFPLATIVDTINATMLIDRDDALAAKDAAEAERDEALAAKDAALVERDEARAQKDAAQAALSQATEGVI